MIAEWNRYEINSPNLFKNLNSDQFWQPILYKLLEKKISEKPSCLYMIEVIKNLRKIKNVQIKVPNQIYIISDNNLSKLYRSPSIIFLLSKYLLSQFLSGNDSLKLFNSSNESIMPHLIDSKFHKLISIPGKKFVNNDSV